MEDEDLIQIFKSFKYYNFFRESNRIVGIEVVNKDIIK